MFVGMGKDSFSIAISRSVFLESSIIEVPPIHRDGGRSWTHLHLDRQRRDLDAAYGTGRRGWPDIASSSARSKLATKRAGDIDTTRRDLPDSPVTPRTNLPR